MTTSNSLLFILITIYISTHKAEDVKVESIARSIKSNPISFFTSMRLNESLVTITLVGPADKWFSIGIGSASMDNTYAFIVSEYGTVTERKLGDHNPGEELPVSVTKTSDTVENGIREIQLTRSRIGYHQQFYTFPSSREQDVPIIAAWASRPGDEFVFHEAANKLNSTTDFALSNETTLDPTAAPTRAPTGAPTPAPTNIPTAAPSLAPTLAPTGAPTSDFWNRYDLFGMTVLGGNQVDNIELLIGIEYTTNTVFINITGPTATWFAIGFGSGHSMKDKYAIIVNWKLETTTVTNRFSLIEDEDILEYFLGNHIVNTEEPLDKFVERKIQYESDTLFRRNVLMERHTFKMNDVDGKYFNFSACDKKYNLVWARGQYSANDPKLFSIGNAHLSSDRGTGSIYVESQGDNEFKCNSVKPVFDGIYIGILFAVILWCCM